MNTTRHLRLICALSVPFITTLVASVVAQSPVVRVMETGDLGHLATNSGAAWGDYDNDRDADLYVPSYQRRLNYLYRNESNGAFTSMGESEIGDLANNDDDTAVGVSGDLDIWADYTPGCDQNLLN